MNATLDNHDLTLIVAAANSPSEDWVILSKWLLKPPRLRCVN